MAAVIPHTDACVYARTGPWGLYPSFDVIRRNHGEEGVAAVLACPHPDHDTPRLVYLGRWRP